MSVTTLRVKASSVEVWQVGGGKFYMLQLYSEGEGFPNVSFTALKGKIFWSSGTKEYYKVTQHNKLHTRDSLGETQKVAGSPQA